MAHEEIVIKAQKRNVIGKQVGALRRSGYLPGVIYGRHITSFPIQMDSKVASYIINRLTSSSLVTIDVEGEKHTTIVRDRQKDVITSHLLHVDFLAVSLTEKLRTNVTIELVGDAPISENIDTVIVQSLNELEIECFPQDLPERIEVDISTLATLDDIILVSNLDLGDKIAILTDENELIASVTYVVQEVEEEEEEVEDLLEDEDLEPEVLEKGKQEDEEPEA
ncbi:MAG: 50S ribosomal protein L25 [Anaerolineaceae bacterium]|nr:50S ribosomal protein L25 [Anaerolineaceae bacterium]